MKRSFYKYLVVFGLVSYATATAASIAYIHEDQDPEALQTELNLDAKYMAHIR
ncbi:hypothetical protein [Pseudobacteriovorax antillogorgiicola]|uniref:Uncharacterized protein n=1 Tax=Pseudobacteriovorax antillogorgiicola TaxID=1513793 RepID=A0A1Y6CFB6_9BACT|nr:hypothetical protein [Pseudobacteriovorax antillogorgiicola]TCS47231.1 hypothetical protein EDD56_1214 [Pseudobacteriovorax antillogorgiicola]SMF61931.1 hypothetical protein SAMN06296036_1214 [Pseudobacteriovorax antillogorgiicola]